MTSKRSGTGGHDEAVPATSGVLDRFGIWKLLGGLERDVQFTHHVAGIIEIRGALKRAMQQRALPLQFFVYSVNPIFDQLFAPWTGHWSAPPTSHAEQGGRRFGSSLLSKR